MLSLSQLDCAAFPRGIRIHIIFALSGMVSTRKVIRVAGRIFLVLLLLIILLLLIGDFTLNRYLNADGNKELSKYLPINGMLTYDRVSLHPFRDFPNLSVRLRGARLADSLITTHNLPPLELDKLYVRISIEDLSKKQIAVEAIDLEGMTINLFDRADGYSTLKNLIKNQITTTDKENPQSGISLVSALPTINIKDLVLNKINEQTGQQAYVSVHELSLKNSVPDSLFNLVLQLENIEISQSAKDEAASPLKLDKAIAKVRVNETFSNWKLEEIQGSGGNIYLFNDSLGNSNFANIIGKRNKQSPKRQTGKTGPQINLDRSNILLEKVDFVNIDQLKNKHLQAHIRTLETEMHMATDTSAITKLDIEVAQLGFNTLKGAYLSQSHVQGQINTKVSSGQLTINSQHLLINGDEYAVDANLSTDKRTPSTLMIEKQDAETTKVLPLLTNNIQESISTYNVKGPIYAKALIIFTPRKKDPRVQVDFRIKNKTVTANGQVLKNANISATFINRLYDDARQFGEDKRNMRLLLHGVNGNFEEFKVASQNAMITSSPEKGSRLVGKVEMKGQAASASRFIRHDNFNFQDGNFTLSADIDGGLDRAEDLLAGADLDITMDDLKVQYPEGNVVFPLRLLELKKKGEKSTFHIAGQTINKQRPFHIEGEIEHIESIFFPARANRLRTKTDIRASSISWEGIVALFGKEGMLSRVNKDRDKQHKRSMKQTLTGLQKSFHPIVRIAIDTVLYGKNFELLEFETGLKFDDAQTLVLEQTSFNLENATVDLDGQVKINELDFTRFDFDIELQHLDFDALMPKFDYFNVHLIKQIHDQPDDLSMHIKVSGELDDNKGLRPETIKSVINYESFAEDKFKGRIVLDANPSTKKVDVVFGHSGHPRSFNHLLETDAYRFDKGWYTISFEFDDNLESIAKMVEESTFNLIIDDAEVYVTDLDVTVPLTRIEVSSLNNKAFYHLFFRSDSLNQEVSFNGIVDNIRHFAFNDTDEPYQVELEISSPRIVWDNFKKVIAYQKPGEKQAPSGKALKETLTKVLRDFNPDVKLKIDSLIYSDQVSFNDIYAHSYIEDNLLVIDSANVSYGESQVEANIDMDMGYERTLPFQMHLELSNIDISQTLSHFDYFDVQELRDAKQIDGNIWFTLDLQAEMDLENEGFNTNKTESDIAVELRDVVVENLHTIDTITEGFGMEKRFEVWRFAPIQSAIKVRGRRVEIREAEIQSNAVQAFVEGTLDRDSPENLWVSIPLKNIKKPDLEITPDRTGYGAAGRKIYLQWISSRDKHNGKMKFHLSKKKFYRERLKPKQFKAYKRINKRARKSLRSQKK